VSNLNTLFFAFVLHDAYVRDLYADMERARTCDSQAKGLPGMFASINNSTDQNGQIIGCKLSLRFLSVLSAELLTDISNAGIPQIANQTMQELDGKPSFRNLQGYLIRSQCIVITPYSTMNTMMVNKTVGFLWWHNMVMVKRMQSEFHH
jgi:hypothetical protein